jgi:threonine dehydrogenase-like Zn-dependent dehydrogenase
MGVSCFAERVVVSQTSGVRVPPGVPPEIAAVSACAVITGLGTAMNAVQGGAGRPLAVLDTGGVGLCAGMGAAGAGPIIAIDVDDTKLVRHDRLTQLEPPGPHPIARPIADGDAADQPARTGVDNDPGPCRRRRLMVP